MKREQVLAAAMALSAMGISVSGHEFGDMPNLAFVPQDMQDRRCAALPIAVLTNARPGSGLTEEEVEALSGQFEHFFFKTALSFFEEAGRDAAKSAELASAAIDEVTETYVAVMFEGAPDDSGRRAFVPDLALGLMRHDLESCQAVLILDLNPDLLKN